MPLPRSLVCVLPAARHVLGRGWTQPNVDPNRRGRCARIDGFLWFCGCLGLVAEGWTRATVPRAPWARSRQARCLQRESNPLRPLSVVLLVLRAGGAEAEDVDDVLGAGEPVFGGDLPGPGLDRVGRDLDRTTAVSADQVVMVAG